MSHSPFYLNIIRRCLLTDIIIPLVVCDARAQLVRLEVGLHVGDLYVGLVGVQRGHVHDVRVLYYNHVLRAETLAVEVLWKEKYCVNYNAVAACILSAAGDTSHHNNFLYFV